MQLRFGMYYMVIKYAFLNMLLERLHLKNIHKKSPEIQ